MNVHFIRGGQKPHQRMYIAQDQNQPLMTTIIFFLKPLHLYIAQHRGETLFHRETLYLFEILIKTYKDGQDLIHKIELGCVEYTKVELGHD